MASTDEADRRRIYIIAEMACSHDGDMDLARTIIDGAGQAGADAIQFQIWTRDDIVVPDHPSYDFIGTLEFTRQEWLDLAAYVREKYPSMHIISCVGETGSVAFSKTFEPDAYKIHTADLSNPALIKDVASTGARIDLSVGASTLDEIQAGIQWIRDTSDSEIWLMYGFQVFPTPVEAIHLEYMKNLRNLFGLPIGYQDHSDGDDQAAFWLPGVAAGMGADCLEKHITHDRAKKGADHEAALNPDEFARFTAMVRKIEAAKGSPAPHPFSPEEERYRKYSKKSIVAVRDLPSGTVIEEADLCALRAAELGLPPDRTPDFLGKPTTRDISAWELLKEEDVK